MALSDIYQKASLVQIPSGYKSGTLYSVVPNTTAGDFTVSSDADATRVNKDGLIETTVANQARLNYDFIDGVVQPNPHLLLEPTRANFIVRSEDFNLWGDTGVTVTENATIAPTGAQTADLLTSTANNWRRSISYTITNGGGYVFSCFVKKYTTTDNIRLELYKGTSATFLDFVFSTQALSASDTSLTDLKVENYPNDWYRVSCKFTANGTNFICYTYPSQGYSVAGSAYFWGAQLEAGNYPTSYIPTSGSAVTRTEDSNEIASGLENIIGQAEGTLFLDFEYLYETTSDSSTDALRDIFVLGTASDISEGVSIDNYRSQFRVFVQGSGMTTQSIGSSSTGSAQPNTRYKLAVKYKTGDCKAYLNGVLLGSSTGTVSFAANLDGIFFSFNSSSRPFKNQKKVHELMVFNTVLTDSELEQITSYNSFGQMAKELLYTIE